MPISYIISQPSANALKAAYRPIVIRIEATETGGGAKPPVVYCDIYFGNVYYKTISKTQAVKLYTTTSEWEFDIQDACQEYLSKFLAVNGGPSIVEATPSFTKVLCKLRSSGINVDGFIEAEGTAPVQATGSTLAIPGTGSLSNEFFVINATLQHKDNQDLASHLTSFKTGQWDTNSYPLTHRPQTYYIGPNRSDYFPVAVDASLCINKIVLRYRYKGQNSINEMLSPVLNICNALITSINVTQVSGTQNVIISWTATGDFTGFYYKIDSGAYLLTTEQSITIEDLTVAAHYVSIKAACNCSEGVPAISVFSIINPEIYTCESVVSDILFTQTGDGTATVTFTSTGAAIKWNYALDGSVGIIITSTSIYLSGLSAGSHSIVITPVCSNEVSGTSDNLTFDIGAMPTITKTSETATGPGGTRTQIFAIGPNVSVGNRFLLVIYSHEIIVTAISGDTPTSIATKLRDAINVTTNSEWNSAGSAPAVGTNGFKPVASSTGAQLTVVMNWGNSFAYTAYFS